MKNETVTLDRELVQQILKELTSGEVSIGTGAKVRAALAAPVPPAEQEECTHDFRMFMSECAKCGEPYKADPVQPAGGEPDALLYRRNDKPDRAWSVTNDPHYIESFRKNAEYETQPLFKPAPPAGGEVEVLGWVVTDMNGDFYFAANRQTPGDVALVDRAHITRLQAEVESLQLEFMAKDAEIKLGDEYAAYMDKRCAAAEAEVRLLKHDVASYLETAAKTCDLLGIDLEAAKTAEGKPSDVLYRHAMALQSEVEEHKKQATYNQEAALRWLGERDALQSELTKALEELDTLRHAVWHALDDSEENAQTGEVTLSRYDFDELSTLVPEEWHDAYHNQSAPAAKDGE